MLVAAAGAPDDFVWLVAACSFCPVEPVEVIGASEGAAATDVESAPEDNPETVAPGAAPG